MYLAVDGQLAGLLAVSDPIKKSTPEAVKDLKAAGIRVIMATGDGVSTAKAVAQQLGIDEIHGEVKPADKLELVSKLQAEGRIRSEEHTSELQSLMRNSYAVFCLKTKKKQQRTKANN